MGTAASAVQSSKARRPAIAPTKMAKTETAKWMDELQAKLRPFLKDQGFRMRARTCNRETAEGLTHVINFQMGRFDPPGAPEIPGLRDNLYGMFTVNVGVCVPEINIVTGLPANPSRY